MKKWLFYSGILLMVLSMISIIYSLVLLHYEKPGDLGYIDFGLRISGGENLLLTHGGIYTYYLVLLNVFVFCVAFACLLLGLADVIQRLKSIETLLKDGQKTDK